ncbi:Hypothetical protein D9617_8g051750 [Elsinoe fawcettii]|nr:Hypothetical protein D9617_8g051750 [Elsinoe fawcettii]
MSDMARHDIQLQIEARQQRPQEHPAQDSFLVILDMTNKNDTIVIKELKVELTRTIRSTKPAKKQCQACTANPSTISTWNFIASPQTFPSGTHKSSATLALPTGSPPTLNSKQTSIDYHVVATAVLDDGTVVSSSEPIVYMPPALNSLSALTRKVEYADFDINVTLPYSIPLDHILNASVSLNTSSRDDQTRRRRWSIRKLDWRIEEHETTTSTTCDQHKGSFKSGVTNTTRTIASGEANLSRRPDTDIAHNPTDSFLCSIPSKSRASPDAHVAERFRITHTVELELFVAEVPSGPDGMSKSGPSGVVRILKPKFDIVLLPSTYGSLDDGVAEQVPPRYEQDATSPPAYDDGAASD